MCQVPSAKRTPPCTILPILLYIHTVYCTVLYVVIWNSQSGNSRGRESGIPGSKTALFWEFPGIPWDSHTEGVLMHTEGVPLHTEGVFWFRFVPENP